ncbi:MAG: TlpA family protein disulfide reductase [Coriobacteriia bacterium]|nr:TlpA family protein disulfide reductase [Coriobacteriia bacterium]MCL2537763.1 TlpA family protein disulfide reductase [Coriobacteriia bacterium]
MTDSDQLRTDAVDTVDASVDTDKDIKHVSLKEKAAESKARAKKKNLTIAAILGVVLVVVIAGALFLQSNAGSGYSALDLLPGSASSSIQGQEAPDFSFLGEQGHVEMLSDYRGTPVVLNFWASWCPPCRAEMPHFQEAFDLHGNDVKFIMLNIDESIEVARAFADELELTFPLYFDESSEGALAYKITGVPETFFIDANGVVTQRFLGAIDTKTITTSIEAMLP